jgi:hypothetical protein
MAADLDPTAPQDEEPSVAQLAEDWRYILARAPGFVRQFGVGDGTNLAPTSGALAQPREQTRFERSELHVFQLV